MRRLLAQLQSDPVDWCFHLPTQNRQAYDRGAVTGFFDLGVFCMSLRFRLLVAGSSAMLLAIVGAAPSSAWTAQPPPAAAEEIEADETDVEVESDTDDLGSQESAVQEQDSQDDQASAPGQAAASGGGAAAASSQPATQLGGSGGGGTGGTGRPVQDPVKGGNR